MWERNMVDLPAPAVEPCAPRSTKALSLFCKPEAMVPAELLVQTALGYKRARPRPCEASSASAPGCSHRSRISALMRWSWSRAIRTLHAVESLAQAGSGFGLGRIAGSWRTWRTQDFQAALEGMIGRPWFLDSRQSGFRYGLYRQPVPADASMRQGIGRTRAGGPRQNHQA